MLGTSKSIWGFDPRSIPGCQLWLDGADAASVVTTPAVVTTIAGSGSTGFANGTGAAASFFYPTGVAVLDGNIVVADLYNSRIRLVTYPGGVVTTLAGSGSIAFADGTGAAASFSYPVGVAVIPGGGVIVVADTSNNRIRLVTYPGGVVTTLAGSGSPAFADGTGAAASFQYPNGVAVIPSDNTIVVADRHNQRIRLVTYPGGVVTTLAGNGFAAFADGTGTAARFNYPSGVAVVPSNNTIVVADQFNNRIRLVTYPGGVVTTIAGSGVYSFADGTGTAASFAYPLGAAVLPNGTIAVADGGNNRIRLVTQAGVVTTLAGPSPFSQPYSVAVISSSFIVVCSQNSSSILLVAVPESRVWNDKSGQSNTMTGTGTLSGGTMVFDGTTNAFSNLSYTFPFGAYSMFAVYSNTTAPAGGAYMNAIYGSNGFPMLGTFGPSRFVSARSVAANTGALGGAVPVGWGARIGGTAVDIGLGIATDPSGNVFATGYYSAALTLYNQGPSGTAGTTLQYVGGQDCFVAKYSSAGEVLWAARIAGTTTSNDQARAIATDTSGNVFVTGYYSDQANFYNQGPSSGAAAATLSNAGIGFECFVAKYSTAGAVLWAARISSTGADIGNGIATDPSGNVYVTGQYSNTTLTIYNQGLTGTSGTTLSNAGANDCFIAKYSTAGAVLWGARIAGISTDTASAIATDTSGNVFVTGQTAAGTFYNQGLSGTAFLTLSNAGIFDVFIAKYSTAGAVLWVARIGSTAPDNGLGIAADTLGNVFVTGLYGAAATFFNQGPSGTAGATLPTPAGTDGFVAKYSPDGAVLWAARIAGSTATTDQGVGIDTDTSGNVLVSGYYSSALTLFNTGGATGAQLQYIGGTDCFVAKYSTDGVVLWATRLAGTSTSTDNGTAIATDTTGNVFVTGNYLSLVFTFYNQGQTGIAGTTIAGSSSDCFIAKYNPDGFININPTSASSNVLVSATYTPSTFSSFVNGFAQTALAGTTLTTTGLFLGGPSNYFSGSISEVLVFGTTLTAAQRQSVEGYLSRKWGIGTRLLTTHPFYTIPPFNRYFNPTDVPGCSLWLDGIDNSSMNSTTTVTSWSDKSGLNNTMTGNATWTGRTMSFNGSTQAFSNLSYVFPISNYSMFAVYSNTTAPAASAYMNAVYGSNGFPMLGTFDVAKNVTARSVVANTGALVGTTQVGWAARVGGTGNDGSSSIGIDPSGNIIVSGIYNQADASVYDSSGVIRATLTYTGTSAAWVAKYSSAGAVLWVTRIVSTGGNASTGGSAVDLSGNVFVTGDYSGTLLTIYNADGTTGATLGNEGVMNSYVVKYSSSGAVVWAARCGNATYVRIAGIATDNSGNVLVTGSYQNAGVAVYNVNGTIGVTLAISAGSTDCFVAKYSSAGVVLWAAQIAGTGEDSGYALATDSNDNVFVTGFYGSANMTLYNANGTSSTTLQYTTSYNCFIAKYSSAGAVLWGARIIAGTTFAEGVATDTSGNVFVTGTSTGGPTVYNASGTIGASLGYSGANDIFLAKYSSTGEVLWATRISCTANDLVRGITTDTSGNVFLPGGYGAAVTLYNANGSVGGTLTKRGSFDYFTAKYSSAGNVVWIVTSSSVSGSAFGVGAAIDSAGNVYVLGDYATSSITLNNVNETTGLTLANLGNYDSFIVKYNSDGYMTNYPFPASSNVLVSATYTPSTFSPFVNGFTTPTLAGTTLATTGIFVGGPSNYFNGTISELLIYSANLSAAQRQQVEGYLIQKWGLSAQTVSNHQYKLIPPATSQPAQLDEVTPGNWTRDWQPYLRSLVAANASATPTYSVLTGTLAGYKIGFLAPNGNIYLPPHGVGQGCALITPTPTGATFSTTVITGVSTGQVYGNDWIGGAMYPDGMLYLIPFDASYNNTPGIADLNTNTNVFRSNPYTAGNTTNFNAQFMSGTMAPDGNMFILPYAVATGGAVSLRFFNPITKLMVAYSVNKPTAERFSFAILAPNGNIYGVAITGPAQACMINPIARTFTTIGSNATVQYRGLVYGGNGSIYMIPNANATGIGILNTTTNTITANAIPGGLGYYGGVLGPDGNIYCIPSTATNIGVINTRTNTFSTLGSVAANSYGSAVLAPNGNIYLIPFGASAIGMISFTGLNMLPSTSFCLSPYVNRGFFTQ